MLRTHGTARLGIIAFTPANAFTSCCSCCYQSYQSTVPLFPSSCILLLQRQQH
jgi:hypothetical protein